MKYWLFFILACFTSNIFCQKTNEINARLQKIPHEQNSIYIFCRGTKRKSALIAQKFNYSDTNITHAGIGFFENDLPVIYNVTDDNSIPGSALKIDSLQSYIGTGDVYYFSIWEYTCSKEELQKLKNICNFFHDKKIWFDASFVLAENDTLYCSEFCASVLNKLNIEKLHFEPRTIDLDNNFYEAVLDRKRLIYFPVDFFERGNAFKKLFEYKF